MKVKWLRVFPEDSALRRSQTNIGPTSILGSYVGLPYTTLCQYWVSVGKGILFLTTLPTLYKEDQHANVGPVLIRDLKVAERWP